ncbi:MAG: phosphotransferase [Candidatus Rokubacteria bacterium]|nr:phosphotransferase [Candidatus Rokubacteria bacterium]MBI3105888.1 phosphotransferase [Candidatus Rokubacteria bacterium]
MASSSPRSSAAAVVQYLAGPGATGLRAFVERQRWFAAKARGLGVVRVEDWAALRAEPPLVLLLVRADDDRYYVPVTVGRSPAGGDRTIGPVGAEMLYDAHWDPDFGRWLLKAISSRRTLPGTRGVFRCAAMEPWGGPSGDEMETLPATPHAGEQSNTSIVFDRRLILKSVRRLQAGTNPEFEMLHFLGGRARFPHAPRLAGWVEYAGDGEATTLALLQQFVVNTGDGWTHALARLGRLCDALDAEPATPGEVEPRMATLGADLLAEIHQLGAVTGGLHAALASDPSLPDFRPEAITPADASRWGRGIVQDLERLAADLEAASSRPPEGDRAALAQLLGGRGRIERAAEELCLLADGMTHKIRCHGDYHLGQVLKTAESFVVIDFEGEPARSLAERRAKHCPLRDVAGMLRSFDYAAHTTLLARPLDRRERLRPWLQVWERLAARDFIEGYVPAAGKSPVRLLPPSAEGVRRACAAFELEKACYELRYELNNRPDWTFIPLAGISRILGATRGDR